MPSIRSFYSVSGQDGLAMMEPPSIGNDEYEDNDQADDDRHLVPKAAKQHRHHRRNRSIPGFMRCMSDTQSDSGSSTSTSDSSTDYGSSMKQKGCSDHARRGLGLVLANIYGSIAIIVLTIGLCVGLGYFALFVVKPSPHIDKSVKSFTIPNHVATRRQDAFDQAETDLYNLRRDWYKRKTRDVSSVDGVPAQEQNEDSMFQSFVNFFTSRRKKRQIVDSNYYVPEYSQSIRRWKITLVYLAQGKSLEGPENDDNIFTKKRVQDIHDIEMKIMRHEGFMDFCHIDYRRRRQDKNLETFGGCAPLNSLMTYFYPSSTDDGRIHYDGLGSKQEDIVKTLKFAMTRDTFYWYVDDKINTTYYKSRVLRTEIHFGAPIRGYTNPRDRQENQSAEYFELMKSYVKLFDESSTEHVRVLYGGNEIFDYEVDGTFWNDVSLAIASLAFIAIFMFILTSFSVYLTFFGLISIVLSFPLAFFFYRYVFGLVQLGLLNGAAAFVIIGIGVDDVFVFINTFRQASHMTNHADRLAHTVITAGLATFFTSFTTAAAFAANVASSIPAVHEFGLFMSLIVSGCWITVILIMPPAINLWVRCKFTVCEHYCFACCTCCSKPSSTSLSLPQDIQNFCDGSSNQDDSLVSTNQMPAAMQSATDVSDVPLLSLDDAAGGEALTHQNNITDQDDPLLQLETELSATINKDDEGCSLTKKMQVFMYHFIAKPVVRARWGVLVVFLCLLGVSGYLVSQLRPSSKPPQLFRGDSNLQMLLDLTANLSDSSIKCDECSGFYKEGSVDPADFTTLPTLPPLPTSTRTSTKVTPLPSTVLSSTAAVTSIQTTTMETNSLTTAAGKPVPSITESNDIAPTPGQTPAPDVPSKPASTPAPGNTPTPGASPAPGASPEPSASPTPGAAPSPAEVSSSLGPSSTSTTTPEAVSTTTASTTVKTTEKMVPKTDPIKPTPAPVKPVVTPAPKPPPAPAPQPPATRKPQQPGSTPKSAAPDYDPCANGKCDDVKERPNLEQGAAVYVVFGIKDIDRSNVSYEHVLNEKGNVVYDLKFREKASIAKFDAVVIRDLCRMCKLISANTDLVRANGSQCLPAGIPRYMSTIIAQYKECKDLPGNQIINGRSLPARAKAGLLPNNTLMWIAFAFESTTKKGQAYFQAYNEYQKWEEYMNVLRTNALGKESPLQSMYQTSEFWKDVMMETVAVTSAIYGLLLSLIICVAAVAIFTGHFLLLIIVIMTIIGAIGLVLSIFYLVGWELGAVEAVSISILVGSSVDYCMHLVEGYILAGKNPPARLQKDHGALRRWRAKAAVSHIGVSIISSAITTIVAAIPLTQTVIKPFSKFGEIVAINTSVSIFYTLTACTAFLALFGPAKYRISFKSVGIAFAVTAVVIAAIVLALFGVSKAGHAIPGPSGENLFPVG